MTHVRVWLSHDGYRDPDDNLALLVGAAKAKTDAESSSNVSVAGMIFGDTTDGGQYHLVNPTGDTPASMDGDARFDDIAKNKVAAGNYAFFNEYGRAALERLAPGWNIIDTVQSEAMKSWNYDARSLSQLSDAAQALVGDIKAAIAAGGGADPNEVVVYSAGGGAHVPAEAIAFLRNDGFSDGQIREHFAIVQHGRSNFTLNTEPEAQDITRTFTIAISKQDNDIQPNGMDGPGLGNLVRNGVWLDGGRFGDEMSEALAVAQGRKDFDGLGANKTFLGTSDGSDAGSHAFAVDHGAVLANWGNRLRPGDTLSADPAHEHQILQADGTYRLRVMYDDFDWRDARELMNGSGPIVPRPDPRPDPGTDPDGPGGPGGGGDLLAGAGPAFSLGDVDLFAFRSDGTGTTVSEQDGRHGVAELGKDHDLERVGNSSEKLIVDLGRAADSIEIVLAGLSSRGDAREAAEITVYGRNGVEVDSMLVGGNGATTLTFDRTVRYAEIEVADWQGDGNGGGSNPDFSVVWLNVI